MADNNKYDNDFLRFFSKNFAPNMAPKFFEKNLK